MEQTEKNNLSPALKAAMDALLDAKVKDIVEFTQELAAAAGIDLNALEASANANSGQQEQKEEKTEFTVMLTSAGANKIQVIKAVKEMLGLGLMESKTFVDEVEKGAKELKKDIKKEEAEEIKAKFEAVGAKVEIK